LGGLIPLPISELLFFSSLGLSAIDFANDFSNAVWTGSAEGASFSNFSFFYEVLRLRFSGE